MRLPGEDYKYATAYMNNDNIAVITAFLEPEEGADVVPAGLGSGEVAGTGQNVGEFPEVGKMWYLVEKYEVALSAVDPSSQNSSRRFVQPVITWTILFFITL